MLQLEYLRNCEIIRARIDVEIIISKTHTYRQTDTNHEETILQSNILTTQHHNTSPLKLFRSNDIPHQPIHHLWKSIKGIQCINNLITDLHFNYIIGNWFHIFHGG